MKNYNSTLQTNNTDLQAILNTINELPEAGGVVEATPVISVNSNGLITATAGTKSSTKQLAFQPAKTITPTKTNQTAVSSGYYTGGDITVAAIPRDYVKPLYTKDATTYIPTTTNQTIFAGTYCSGVQTIEGDSNLIAENIKSGVSIFGVNGTAEVGDDEIDGLITRNLTSYTNKRVSCVGSYAFAYCDNLTTVSFPAATTIGNGAFSDCYNLTTASFPEATTIGRDAFNFCRKLTTASFPAATTIGSGAFAYCYNLTTASFPAATTIGSDAFYYCYNLKSLYLAGSSVCTLSHYNAFSFTPIGDSSASAGTYGSIYVPASLLTSYQTATNWTYFSSRFVGI